MELVIDANIVISALIANGITQDIIFAENNKLYAPEYLQEEIREHEEEILEKTGFTKKDLDLALSILFSKIKIIPATEFSKHIKKAKEICPDPDDTEYFALALQLNCALWSNDKKLKNQQDIRVINTTELLKQ